MSASPATTPQLMAVHPVLMVADVPQTLQFFDRLGFSVAFVDDEAQPRYAGLQRDGVEIHVQRHAAASTAGGQDRPVYRFLVRDVDALYAEFCARAASALATAALTPWHAPADTPWGTREFHVHDTCRNGLQFYQRRPASPAPADTP